MTAAPEPTPHARRSGTRRGGWMLLVAAVAYAAVFVVWTWPLATLATSHTAMLAEHSGQPTRKLEKHDQAAVISLVARNAAAILDGDLGRLIDQDICHPMPDSATFGEHGIEVGILGLPVYALSRDPILAYNSSILLLIVIGGVGMFALVRFLTGSAAAGFFAGALFAFDPSRLGDLGHPHVIGLHWIPPTLLMFERFLGSGRAGDAALLALFGSLQTLVGSYPLMAFAAFVGPYGLVRLFQLRARLDARRAVGLAVAVFAVGCVAAAVLVPYAITGSTWGGLEPRGMVLIRFDQLLPGGRWAIAPVALLLLLPLAVLRTSGPTATAAVSLGTAACAALSTGGALWPGGPKLAGLYPWLAGHIELLGSVRVPAAIGHGVDLGFAILAGLGLARALDHWKLAVPGRAAAAAVAVAAAWIPVFQPDLAQRVYQSTQRAELTLRMPLPEVSAAYRAFDERGLEGPIIEIPFTISRGVVYEMPRYVLMAAYHQRKTAACFRSHLPPTWNNMARIVSRLPREGAFDELAASGFRNLVVYDNVLAKMPEVLATARRRQGIRAVYESDTVSSLRIDRPVEVHSDPERLVVVASRLYRDRQDWGESDELDVAIENRARPVWVLPRPVAPAVARVRWWKRGIAGPWTERPFLLPIALAPGSRDWVSVRLGRPPTGCPCRLEVEIPALGWRLDPTQDMRRSAAAADVEGSPPVRPPER